MATMNQKRMTQMRRPEFKEDTLTMPDDGSANIALEAVDMQGLLGQRSSQKNDQAQKFEQLPLMGLTDKQLHLPWYLD